jgi:D-tyrosyl-tRNA(Tyr) deacylase
VVILLGIGPTDLPADAAKLANKLMALRIFPGPQGAGELSLLEVAGEALVVSQFTLYADTSRGRRPSFVGAGPPSLATFLCDEFVSRMANAGIATRTGKFGAQMELALTNDGPFTLVLSTDPWETTI